MILKDKKGFGLDIDWGDYPYVTSSGCTVGAAIANGVPAKRIRNVWGVAKVYETYVGLKEFQPDDPIFDKIRDAGAEYGATTGRPRQCNWIDSNNFFKAVDINGANKIVFNKADILRQLKTWKIYDEKGFLVSFKDEFSMKEWFLDRLPRSTEVFWSDSPDRI